MYAFTYHRPKTLAEAAEQFGAGEDAAYVSGGHTLIPAMKSRLSAPSDLVDLSRLADLKGIQRDGEQLVIGAGETHAAVAANAEVIDAIPALAALAGSIGDVQVRYRGTMGGSVANNDPAADYPAAVLALGATVRTTQREIAAEDFFDGLYTTVLEPGEIITSIAFPVPTEASYAKMRNPASRYALCAVFVARFDDAVRVAITGAGNDGVFRWTEAEEALSSDYSPKALEPLQLDPAELLGDIHAEPAFRARLAHVCTRRAVAAPGKLTLC